MRNWLAIAILSCLSSNGEARLLRGPVEGVRPAGMGNAFLAVADDENSLWYNPAGLADTSEVHFHLFDFNLGFDSLDTLTRLKNAVFEGDYSNLFRTDTQYLRLSVAPSLFVPYFAVSAYFHSDTFLDMQNFSGADLDIASFHDAGAIAGVGLPVGKYLSIGAAARVFQRIAVDETIAPLDLLAQLGIPQSTFEEAVYDYLMDRAGEGWALGVTLGALAKIPVGSKTTELRFAFVAQDFGGTRFTALAGKSAPKELPGQYHFGSSLRYTLARDAYLRIAVDWRDALSSSSAILKRLSLGIELKSGTFSLRAGIREGRWSLGASLDVLPHTRLDFVTFGRELGESLFEREYRLYLMRLAIGFNPF